MSARRDALKGMVAVIALIGIGEAMAARLANAAVNYQDKPNAGRDCDHCIHYIPGPVSAHGYCMAFTPKPKTGSSA